MDITQQLRSDALAGGVELPVLHRNDRVFTALPSEPRLGRDATKNKAGLVPMILIASVILLLSL